MALVCGGPSYLDVTDRGRLTLRYKSLTPFPSILDLSLILTCLQNCLTSKMTGQAPEHNAGSSGQAAKLIQLQDAD